MSSDMAKAAIARGLDACPSSHAPAARMEAPQLPRHLVRGELQRGQGSRRLALLLPRWRSALILLRRRPRQKGEVTRLAALTGATVTKVEPPSHCVITESIGGKVVVQLVTPVAAMATDPSGATATQ
jgi:hypothetical protein